jgi:hypothetical protein
VEVNNQNLPMDWLYVGVRWADERSNFYPLYVCGKCASKHINHMLPVQDPEPEEREAAE